MAATHRLVQKCNPKQTFINFVIELEDLDGRKAFAEGVEVETLLKL
jgi:adenine/guanine phosphoribosyltransferase-like PRPP-binding protein